MAATFGAGLGYACVVDVGDQKTSVSCVEDGISHPNTRVSIFQIARIHSDSVWTFLKSCSLYSFGKPLFVSIFGLNFRKIRRKAIRNNRFLIRRYLHGKYCSLINHCAFKNQKLIQNGCRYTSTAQF